MKKIIIYPMTAFVLCASVISTSSCSKKKLKEAGAELITIYGRDFEEWSNEYFQKAVDTFNDDLTDGIEVELKIFDDQAIENAISSAQQSGNNLDIYLVSYSNLYEQVNTNCIVPLENYFDKEFFDDYTDTAKKSTTLYEKIYGVPYCFETSELLFYSKSMFSKAGITSEPKTYTDMLDACSKLSAVIDKKTQTVISTPLGVPTGWANNGQFWNAANGEYPISEDWSRSLCKSNKSGYVQFLDYYKQLYSLGYASRSDTAGGYNEIIGELCQGRVAMTYAGAYAVGSIYNDYIASGDIQSADDIGCCYVPSLYPNLASTFNGGWSFVLSTGCASKDCTAEKALGKKRGQLAAKFLDWYTRGSAGQSWLELGKCCKQTGFKSMQAKLDISQVSNPYYAILKEAANTAPSIDCYPYSITSELAKMIEAVMQKDNRRESGDLVDEAHAAINQIISTSNLAGKNPRSR